MEALQAETPALEPHTPREHPHRDAPAFSAVRPYWHGGTARCTTLLPLRWETQGPRGHHHRDNYISVRKNLLCCITARSRCFRRWGRNGRGLFPEHGEQQRN